MRALTTWEAGPYRSLFAYGALTFAIVTPSKPKRRETLRVWTADELTRLGYTIYADNYLFTDQPPDSDPRILFTQPVWYTAAGDIAVALLEEE